MWERVGQSAVEVLADGLSRGSWWFAGVTPRWSAGMVLLELYAAAYCCADFDSQVRHRGWSDTAFEMVEMVAASAYAVVVLQVTLAACYRRALWVRR